MSHTIEAAMKRGELTEEEAFFILRFAGNMGYGKAIKRLTPSLMQPLRRWFIWIGGWERPELSQWDRGVKAWDIFGKDCVTGKTKVNGPTPLSLFGHRITFQCWGIRMKWGRGHLTWSSDYAYFKPTKLYWSPDGTPGHPNAKFFWRKKRSGGGTK